jgi:hypothetical protein
MGGRPMVCPPTRAPLTVLPCVGLAGSPPYPIFFINFAGFVVGPAYRGVDDKAMGHLIVSATPERHAPAHPCIGEITGRFSISHRRVTEYRCSADSVRVGRQARHGEGAHLGHLLLDWKQNGVDYVISAHGYTSVNLALLKRLVASMTLVAATP